MFGSLDGVFTLDQPDRALDTVSQIFSGLRDDIKDFRCGLMWSTCFTQTRDVTQSAADR